MFDLISIPWTLKPPQGTPLDWSNPLNTGLIFCAPLNEVAGSPLDIVTSKIGTLAANSTRVPAGISTASGAESSTIPTTALQGLGTADFTVLFKVQPAAYTSGKYYLMTSAYGILTGMFCFYFSAGGSYGNLNFAVYNGAFVAAPAFANDLQSHVFVGVRQSTRHELYVDGRSLGVTPATTKNVSSANPVMALASWGSGAYTAAGIREAVYVWNRVLTDQEITAVSQNPWQIFQPQLVPLFLGGAAFSGTSRAQLLTGISRGRISCGY